MGRIYCLHGFLGKPEDWSPWIEAWRLNNEYEVIRVDCEAREEETLETWANNFNRNVSAVGHDNVLIAYSQGGRLGLHALVQNPALWRAAIIISANPGLKDPQERNKRLCNDQAWSERFLSEEWGALLKAWDAQPVLAASRAPSIRSEADYSRERLARSLSNWSLGKQEDLRPALAMLDIPALWLCGEEDAKFFGIASEMSRLMPCAEMHVLPEAGHRCPWDQPQAFGRLTENFLKTHRSPYA